MHAETFKFRITANINKWHKSKQIQIYKYNKSTKTTSQSCKNG